jgi:aspartyl-tRNA(Asn)/glutamyl-tRNA(Gln) amidotransferase subunit C
VRKTVVALSKEDVEYIANLAKLEIGVAEIPAYTDKLGRIIEFIDELSAVELADIVPMAHPLAMSQRLRPDVVTETDERERYQENAPETLDGLYIVPRVLE